MSALQLIQNKRKRDLVKRLVRQKVSNVKLEKGYISFIYDGHRIRNRAVMSPNVKWVGTWSRRSNKVMFDDDMRKNPKEILSILIHESVEKYIAHKYGLSTDVEGHYVAEHVERNFAKQLGINWDSYLWKTEFVHRKEMVKHEKDLKRQINALKFRLKKYEKI